MGKELQKNTKLTVQVLKEENSLAVRGLKDLQLVNTPRLLYLAGLYNECVELCSQMESLSAEDCFYWIKSQKKWKHSLSSKAHSFIYWNGYFREYIEAYNQLLSENEVNRVDDQYYGYCLVEVWEDEKALEALTKALKFYQDIHLPSGISWGIHLYWRRWDLYYKIGDYKNAINDYLKMGHHIMSRRWLILAECFYLVWEINKSVATLKIVESELKYKDKKIQKSVQRDIISLKEKLNSKNEK